MQIYAGIDEAGYGPVLGPLCVACTVFAVQDQSARDANHDQVPDLWKRLNKAVCRKRTDRRRRIAVNDSKLLKGPPGGPHHPLKFLERGVLAFRMAMADCPACDDDLFDCLDVRVTPADWYASRTELPVGQPIDELRIAAARLRRTMQIANISCELMRCEAIDTRDFNDQVDRMHNKASVNLCAALRMIDTIWQRWPECDPAIIVDHHGGRTHYREALMQCYPDAQAEVMQEEESLSAYRLTRRVESVDSTLSISFVVEADSRHLPVALASMTAKYVRELFMLRMNRHFCGLLPALKPTAGYHEDGRRYLAEIEPLITGRQIDRSRLVRCV